MNYELSGKTVVVTGATSGIGLAVVRKFTQHGAFVIGVGRSETRNQDAFVQLSATKSKGEAVYLLCDLADQQQIKMLSKAIHEVLKKRQRNCIDILVNNAAILADRTLKKMSEEEWHSVINVNLTGIFNCSRAVIEGMIENGWGRIISMSSISGQVGFWGQANYAAAKAGVMGFTKSLARETASKNITVNAIAPGIVETDMARQIPENVRQEFMKQIPMGRFAVPEEIAELACFLASDRASYITGQTIHINGGWCMQ